MEAAKTHNHVHPNPTKVSFLVCGYQGPWKSNPLRCFSLHAAKKENKKNKKKHVGLGWGSPGPSYFVLWGVCLYDTVVFRCDLRQGIRQVCLPQFAFLVRENLPAVENTDRVPGEKTCSHCAETHHTDVTQYVRRRSRRSKRSFTYFFTTLTTRKWKYRLRCLTFAKGTAWLLSAGQSVAVRQDGLWALASCYVTPMFVLKQHSIKVPSRKTAESLRVWATFRHTKHFTLKKTASFRCLYLVTQLVLSAWCLS